MIKICHIAAALPFNNEIKLNPSDLVIAADAGYEQLVKRGLRPDLIVGDFDSLGSVPEGDNILRHPVMKDDTDLMLALKLGLEKGYKVFYIYGGLGGRLDHTIANIQALDYLNENGGIGYLFGETETATVFSDGELCFTGDCKGLISVFAQGGTAEGVTLKGLLYPLNNAILRPAYPLGVSNEFTGAKAVISVRKGKLLVIWTGEPTIMSIGTYEAFSGKLELYRLLDEGLKAVKEGKKRPLQAAMKDIKQEIINSEK